VLKEVIQNFIRIKNRKNYMEKNKKSLISHIFKRLKIIINPINRIGLNKFLVSVKLVNIKIGNSIFLNMFNASMFNKYANLIIQIFLLFSN